MTRAQKLLERFSALVSLEEEDNAGDTNLGTFNKPDFQKFRDPYETKPAVEPKAPISSPSSTAVKEPITPLGTQTSAPEIKQTQGNTTDPYKSVVDQRKTLSNYPEKPVSKAADLITKTVSAPMAATRTDSGEVSQTPIPASKNLITQGSDAAKLSQGKAQSIPKDLQPPQSPSSSSDTTNNAAVDKEIQAFKPSSPDSGTEVGNKAIDDFRATRQTVTPSAPVIGGLGSSAALSGVTGAQRIASKLKGFLPAGPKAGQIVSNIPANLKNVTPR